MAITLRNAGTWDTITAATAVTLPTHQTGDMLIVRVVAKSSNVASNVITCDTAGWVKLGQGENGTTNSGNGTGSVQVALFYKIATSASETNPTITPAVDFSPAGVVAMAYQKNATEIWMVPVGDDGPDTTSGTSHSATIATHVAVKVGDVVDAFTGICDNTTMTVPTFTQTGVTYDTVTESPATALASTTGNDIAADGCYRTATAGISSAAAVVTSTLSTAETGTSWMTRLRVVGPSLGQAQASVIVTGRAYSQATTLISRGVFSVSDTFTRSVSNSLGTADTGGSYTLRSGDGTQWDVDGSKVVFTSSETTITQQQLKDVLWKTTAAEVTLDISVTSVGSGTGNLTIVPLLVSVAEGAAYGIGPSLLIPLATLDAEIQAQVGASTFSGDFVGTLVVGNTYRIKGQVLYTPYPSTLRIRVKAWDLSGSEPGWKGTTDTSSVTIYNKGIPAITIHQGNSTTAFTLDNFSVSEIGWTESGQAQAKINAFDINKHSQAQAQIKTTYYGLGQSQTWIVNTYYGLGQAQGTVLTTYFGLGQAQANIKQVYYGLGQAQTFIIYKRNGLANANALINGTYFEVYDTFTRSVTDGMGTADIGGAWTRLAGTAADADVNGSELTVQTSASSYFSGLTQVLLGTQRGVLFRFKFKIDTVLSETTTIVRLHIGTGSSDVGSAAIGYTAQILYNTPDDTFRLRLGKDSALNTATIVPQEAGVWFIAEGLLIKSSGNQMVPKGRLYKEGDTPSELIIAGAQSIGNLSPGHVRITIPPKTITFIIVSIDDLSVINGGWQEYGQSQARIKNTYNGLGQTQASIKTTYSAHGQSQTQIKQTYNVYGQAQAHIKGTYSGLGQAQAFIDTGIYTITDTFTRTVSDGMGTPDVGPDWVYLTGTSSSFDVNGSALVQTTPNSAMQAYYQPRVSNKQTTHLEATITVKSFGDENAATINVRLLASTISTGNGNGVIFQVHGSTKDVVGLNLRNGNTTQTTTIGTMTVDEPWIIKGQILQTSLTNINLRVKVYKASDPEPGWQLTTRSTTTWANIGMPAIAFSSGVTGSVIIELDNYQKFDTGWTESGQAQAKINAFDVNNHAQAQAQIKQTYNVHGQAEASIEIPTVSARAYAQAQAQIKTTYNVHAQAQSWIEQTYNSLGQAQTLIAKLVTFDNFDRTETNTWGIATEGSFGWGSRISDYPYIYVDGSAAYGDAPVDSHHTGFPLLKKGMVQFDFRTSATRTQTADLYLDAWNEIYTLFFTATTVEITSYFAGNQLITGVDASTWYTFKGTFSDIPGTAIHFKVWKRGDPEPYWMQTDQAGNVPHSAFGTVGASLLLDYPGTATEDTGIDNFYLWTTEQPILLTRLGQAQTDIKQTYYGLGQTQSWIEQTYNGLGQAQGTILATYFGLGQAQTNIEQTYNSHGQAQADIKQTYVSHGQSQADIKQTYYGLGQSQALIVNTYYVHAQSQAWIKNTYYGLGQSQGSIKQIYNIHGQAQGDIKQTYLVYSQAQALITNTYFGSGQSQAQIKQTYFALAQAQATITGNAFGQAQGQIKQTYNVHAQSQAWIEDTYNQHGQTQAWIEQTYNALAQTQAQIKQTYVQHGQAQADILQTYFVHGQAQSWIKNTYFGLGQAQANIKQTYYVHAQAQARLIAFDVNQFGQAEGNIRFTGNAIHAQTQAKINAFDYPQHGQAQAQIKATYNAHGQAQANIEQTYNSHGQAQGTILQIYFGLAQAQADIKATYNVHGQANAYIILSGLNVHGQAQANIRDTYSAHAQAQALILRTENGHGQAQGDIKNTYFGLAQAQADIEQIYNQHAQSAAIIKNTYFGSGQANAHIHAYNVVQHGQAQANIQFQGNAAFAQAQAKINAFDVNAHGQSQAWIETTYSQCGQAQGTIKNTYVQVGQSQATITNTYFVHGQSQAYIKALVSSCGQAQGSILQIYTYCGQTQGQIKQTYIIHGQAQALISTAAFGSGQAQSWIKSTYNQVAQAQAQIKNTYNTHANAQSYIYTTGNSYAQAQATIKTTYFSCGQAEAYIISGRNGLGQAEAWIKSTYNQHGQAEAFISKLAGYGQAQAHIRQDRIIKNFVVSDRHNPLLTLSDRNSVVSSNSDRNNPILINTDNKSITLELSDTRSITLELSDNQY